jgi:hypothetical protein
VVSYDSYSSILRKRNIYVGLKDTEQDEIAEYEFWDLSTSTGRRRSMDEISDYAVHRLCAVQHHKPGLLEFPSKSCRKDNKKRDDRTRHYRCWQRADATVAFDSVDGEHGEQRVSVNQTTPASPVKTSADNRQW